MKKEDYPLNKIGFSNEIQSPRTPESITDKPIHQEGIPEIRLTAHCLNLYDETLHIFDVLQSLAREKFYASF